MNRAGDETGCPRARGSRILLAGAAAALWIACCGCQREMWQQPRYDPLQPSEFYSNGMSARPLEEGTVAQGQFHADESFFTGSAGGRPLERFPMPITMDLLERGRQRYDIYCAVCHGLTGEGDGMVVRHGFPQPPSFHIDRLRRAPVGHFFQVISEGHGVMYPYAARVAPDDRWRIVAYIRALQLSRAATLAQVPPDVRQRMARSHP